MVEGDENIHALSAMEGDLRFGLPNSPTQLWRYLSSRALPMPCVTAAAMGLFRDYVRRRASIKRRLWYTVAVRKSDRPVRIQSTTTRAPAIAPRLGDAELADCYLVTMSRGRNESVRLINRDRDLLPAS